MSFILDALKKSEQERRQGEVPGLQDETPAPAPRKGSPWLVLLAAALLVNGAVLGWWLSSRQESTGTLQSPAESAPAPVIRSADRAAPEAVTPAISRPLESRSKIDASAASDSTGPDPSLQNQRQGGRTASPPPVPSQGESSIALRSPEMLAESEQPGAKTVGEARVEEAVTPNATAPTPSTQASRDANREPSPEKQRLLASNGEELPAAPAAVEPIFPALDDLAAPVRARLPELSLQLHFFTADPQRRLIRLNGTNLREGQETGDHIAVIGIDPDGVRLRCKGTRVFLPAGG